jgi:hypothetical protein
VVLVGANSCPSRVVPGNAVLAESAGDHHPVALGQGVGEVLGLGAQTLTLRKLVSRRTTRRPAGSAG